MSNSWSMSGRAVMLDNVHNQERDVESFFSSDTVVIGVGNTILSDDGVGVHAARLLQADPRVPAGITILDGGTMGPELVSYASNASYVLLLDALNSDSTPGTLARLRGEDLLAAKSGWSVHQMGVADLISALFLVAGRTQEIVVLGVQPSNINWGTSLSAEVQSALGSFVDAAVAQLQLWNEPRENSSHDLPTSTTSEPYPERALSAGYEKKGFGG